MAKRRREIEKRRKQPEGRQVKTTEPDRGKPQGGSEQVVGRASIDIPEAVARDTWYYHNRENLLLGLLVLYVFLLGLGTVGELFEIEWVLNLPLFK